MNKKLNFSKTIYTLNLGNIRRKVSSRSDITTVEIERIPASRWISDRELYKKWDEYKIDWRERDREKNHTQALPMFLQQVKDLLELYVHGFLQLSKQKK